MKRIALILSLAMILMAGNVASAQEQPKPKKDTVNIDTDAKPTFYYAEEEKPAGSIGSGVTIAIVAGVIVVLAGGFYFMMKRKK